MGAAIWLFCFAVGVGICELLTRGDEDADWVYGDLNEQLEQLEQATRGTH